ncbi:hypothetical protein E2C01_099021 [Portunus trituberculatus]|uniref:Uncharacterized protein n=1 Tax=Portunus trituberculatus TaxID=210409 RepID=A0A5B7K9Q9_PORTR|nr:hypothetical protein [Portunus trituberculatus]
MHNSQVNRCQLLSVNNNITLSRQTADSCKPRSVLLGSFHQWRRHHGVRSPSIRVAPGQAIIMACWTKNSYHLTVSWGHPGSL